MEGRERELQRGRERVNRKEGVKGLTAEGKRKGQPQRGRERVNNCTTSDATVVNTIKDIR